MSHDHVQLAFLLMLFVEGVACMPSYVLVGLQELLIDACTQLQAESWTVGGGST